MLTSLAEMKNAVDANMSVADEFALINECGDSKAYVDGDALIAIQTESLDKINTLFNMCIAAFVIMAVEVGCCCCVGCLTAMDNSGCRVGRCMDSREGVCEEVGFFMSLTKYG